MKKTTLLLRLPCLVLLGFTQAAQGQVDTVYSSNFSTGVTGGTKAAGITVNWSTTTLGTLSFPTVTTKTAPSGRVFLGLFGQQKVTLSITGLRSHSRVFISYDLYTINTWDGDVSAINGPDVFRCDVASTDTLLNSNFSTQSWVTQSFPNASSAAGTGSFGHNLLGSDGSTITQDYEYHFADTAANSGDSVTFNFTGNTINGGTNVYDEPWGLDSITVRVDCDTATISLSRTGSASICRGDTSRFSASSGYSAYQWYRNDTLIAGATSQHYTTPTTLSPGSYQYRVTAGACASVSDTLHLVVHQPPAVSMRDTSTCYGSPIHIGSNATGDAPPFTYYWTPSTGLDHSDSARPIASPLTTTTYYVIVSDTNGCQMTDSVTVHINPLPILSLVRDTTVCQRTPVQIGAYATGNASPFTYYWTPSTGLDHPDSARPIATPLATTTYYVIVTDTNGCQVTDSVMVHINPLPVAHAGGNKSMCLGSAVQIGLPASGGTAPYVYQWTPSTGLSSTSVSSPTASPTVTTKYYVAVQDKNGCTALDSTVVTVNPQPQLAKLPDIQVCPGTTAQLGESATGGTSPYTYRWSPTTGLDDPTKATPTVTPTGSGMYTLTVTDANGCTTMVNQYVAVFDEPHPTIVADRTKVYCSTDSALLQLNIAVSTSKWSTGSTARAIRVGPGRYWAEITDLNGCKGYSDTVTITQIAPPTAVITGPTSACPNSTGSYESKDANIASYEWTLTGGGTIASGQGTPKIAVNWSTAGSWQISLKETMVEGGCERDTTLTVTVDKDLHPTISQDGPGTICTGDTVTLATTSGYDTYRWSSGETTESIAVTTTGDYTVTVSNAAGCTGTSSVIHIDVLPDSVPRPVITAPTLSLCAGDSVELRTSQSYASYQWSTGEGAPSIWVTKSGRYAVTVSNAAGCTGTSDTVTVTVNPKPSIALNALGATEFCEGDSVTLSTTKGFGYNWQRDGVTLSNNSDLLIVKQSGTYTVTATNASGCSATSNAITVTVKPLPKVTIDGPSSLCLGGTSGYRVKGASGGTVRWQLNPSTLGTITGQGTDTITIDWANQQDAGVLTVSVVTDGCEGTATVPITIDSKLTPHITPTGPLAFCDGESVTLDAGTGYATYEWRLNGTPIVGRTSHDLTVSQSGTFTVYVTSTGGCSGESAAVTVTVYPLPAKPVITANGTTLTSTAAARYRWLRNGETIVADSTQSIIADSVGDYVVVIANDNGCETASDPFHYEPSFAIRVLLPHSRDVAPGDPILIPVTLSGVEKLTESGATSYAGTIRVPAHLATPVSPVGTQTGGDWLIPIAGPWSQGQTRLQTLTLKAGTLDPDCSDVTVDTFYFPNAPITVTSDIARICVTGECHPVVGISDTAFAINYIIPNPSQGSFMIRYHIADAGPVELLVEDVLGRPVKYFVKEFKPVGSYESVLSTAGIATGAYRVVLRSGARARTARVEFVN